MLQLILGRVRTFREGTLILTILVVAVIMSFLSPHFLTVNNIRTTLLSFATNGIVVVGITIVMILGGIDLSVGSTMALSMVVSGRLFLMGMPIWFAIIFGLLAAAMVGVTIGFFVTRVGLSPFITTLAMMGIARGLCFVITQGTPLSLFRMPAEFKNIGLGSVAGIPYGIIIFTIIVVTADFLMRRSRVARLVYYTGSNETAAIYSGVNTKRVKHLVYIICSTMAGLAGILYMSRFSSATPGFGAGLELTAISAAVIGGASLNGGEGTVFGAVLGIALLAVITTSMILLNVSVYWQDLIRGSILLMAVSLDYIRHRH
ncbi:MAG: ABC transporter permease [Spirochaetaceae bacterium]|nr:MAG: ABC transporter permease [Spirochaetaceae bacterium]